MEKSFISPLSKYRMVTAFYRVSQKVSDVIPVLLITPRATESSIPFLFFDTQRRQVRSRM